MLGSSWGPSSSETLHTIKGSLHDTFPWFHEALVAGI